MMGLGMPEILFVIVVITFGMWLSNRVFKKPK
jgi:hypothetical protein